MSLKETGGDTKFLWFLAGGLVLYSLLLTMLTGDIGFSGDDWWILELPYWNNYFDALTLYAQKFLRPVEGVYWISLFKLVGFNKMAFHLCSLLLSTTSVLIMGVALNRAFPDRKIFVSMAVLFAFFLPPVSCLTYILFTDNSRLSMLLFWVSVLWFQRWAIKSASWHGLAFPIAAYLGSFLTYEAASFLLLLVPILVWPPVQQAYSDRTSQRSLFIKLFAGILTAFVAGVTIRFMFLNGGAVTISFPLPPFELLWSYFALLPFYLMAPFTFISGDQWTILLSSLVALACVFQFGCLFRDRYEGTARDASRMRSQWSILIFGFGVLVLGMLPYQLAGYGSFNPKLVDTVFAKIGALPDGDLSWFNFTWASRIYSSASFGIAILLAYVLGARRQRFARIVGLSSAVIIIGAMSVFHAGLSRDWREAAEIRNDIWRSLVSQVPAVKSGTNFVFLDLAFSHKRAEVIRKENGLRELVQMLYGDQTLGAWRIYSNPCEANTHEFRKAAAIPAGLMACAGQRQLEPASFESILLFKRSGRKLVLLNKIEANDDSLSTGIIWRGVERITSNLDRIQTWSAADLSEVRSAGTKWIPSLISTFELTKFRLPLTSLNALRYTALSDILRRQLFKIRSHRTRM